jgi:tetratricopeptide (TPR) repeat protein
MLLDRRMACLDHWLDELSAVVALVDRAADPVAVDHAARAAVAMSPLAMCADAVALGDALPLPVDGARRLAAESVVRTAREIEVAERAGDLDGLAARAAAAVAEARRVDYAPALAVALQAQAKVAFSIGDQQAGEAGVRELAQIAATAHDDRAAVFAWTQLIESLGREQGKPDAALALVPTASAAVLRAGDTPDLRADLLQRQAAVLDYGPHPEQGLALLREARRVLETSPPTSATAARIADIVFETATAQVFTGDNDGAIASVRDAIDRWRTLYGADSPDEAFGWQNLGAIWQRGKHDAEALDAFRTAVRIRQARLGEVPMTATSMVAVGTVLNDQGHWDDALAIYDRVIAIDRKHLAPDDLQLARVMITRANTLTHTGRLDEAARGYDDAIALYERIGSKSLDAATVYYSRAHLATRRGHCDAALPDYTRAIALTEELRGSRSERLVYSLVGEALCEIRGHHLTEARAALERAVALPEATTNTFQLAVARAYLGWVNIATARDARAGRAAIASARSVIATDTEGRETLDEIECWLSGCQTPRH